VRRPRQPARAWFALIGAVLVVIACLAFLGVLAAWSQHFTAW
jgi:hypothetical protein